MLSLSNHEGNFEWFLSITTGEVLIIVPKNARIIVVSIWILAAFGALAGTSVDSLAPVSAPGTSVTPNRIVHIFINGNNITRPYVIMAFCDFDTGSVFDSLAIQSAERRLRATRLFLSVNLLSLRRANGYDIYILVSEYPLYLTFPPVFGLNRYFWLHHDEGSWYCPQAGLELTNLGGRMEDLALRRKSACGRTIPPFGPNRFSPRNTISGSAPAYLLLPDPSYNWDLQEVTGGLTIGRPIL